MALVREIAHAVLRLAAEDPNLIRRVVSVLGGEGSTNAPDRLLMKKGSTPSASGYSVRTLDKFVEAGLPVHGRGKRLRIVVARAEWCSRRTPSISRKWTFWHLPMLGGLHEGEGASG